MIQRDGLPETPDWIGESRCCAGCNESATPLTLTFTRTEVKTPLCDQHPDGRGDQ